MYPTRSKANKEMLIYAGSYFWNAYQKHKRDIIKKSGITLILMKKMFRMFLN